MDPETKFQKDLSFLRAYILGRKWWTAHEALEFARSKHDGYRKDGVTPEFHHQVQIALNARTFEGCLIHPEETIAVAVTHDLVEDFEDVTVDLLSERFGPRIGSATSAMSKKGTAVPKTEDECFAEMAEDPIASVNKGLDRCNNVWTMRGVFGREKRESYIADIDDKFIPMLRAARRRFPQQEPAYQNIIQQLRTMRDIYLWAHEEFDLRNESQAEAEPNPRP